MRKAFRFRIPPGYKHGRFAVQLSSSDGVRGTGVFVRLPGSAAVVVLTAGHVAGLTLGSALFAYPLHWGGGEVSRMVHSGHIWAGSIQDVAALDVPNDIDVKDALDLFDEDLPVAGRKAHVLGMPSRLSSPPDWDSFSFPRTQFVHFKVKLKNEGGRLVFEAPPLEIVDWGGFSGAGVFTQKRLIGVCTHERSGSRRLIEVADVRSLRLEPKHPQGRDHCHRAWFVREDGHLSRVDVGHGTPVEIDASRCQLAVSSVRLARMAKRRVPVLATARYWPLSDFFMQVHGPLELWGTTHDAVVSRIVECVDTTLFAGRLFKGSRCSFCGR